MSSTTLLNTSSTTLYYAIAVLCLMSISFFIYKKRKGSAASKINDVLRHYIIYEIKEVIIPDGIGGLLEVEHIILTEQGLLLIETYPMSGNLFGAETIDQWTQIVDGRSYKFANPLRRIRTSRQALKALAPKAPVYCRIIFNANSVFPKGKPDDVSTISSLADDMTALKNEPVLAHESKQAWDKVMRIARKNGQAVQRQGRHDGE